MSAIIKTSEKIKMPIKVLVERMDPALANFIDSISGKEAAALLESLLNKFSE